MSPGRRRDLTPFVLLLVVGAVALFLLVGGLVYVGRASGPYERTIDRSFGVQARLLAVQSNSVGTELRTLMDQMASERRLPLAEALDSLVEGSEAVASGAALAAVPAPEDGAGVDFVEAMADRASAMTGLRRTVDGLLRLTPGGGSPYPPPRLSAAQAIRSLEFVGQLLARADGLYRAAARALLDAPGQFRLPRSVWVATPVVWGAGAVQTTVEQLVSAPSLAPFKDVHLVSVSLVPPLLPPPPVVAGQPQAPPLPPGASEVPPTCTLSVTAVIRNDGTLVAADVPVEAAVAPLSGGPPFPVRRNVTLGPSGSVALTLPAMPVVPGSTYDLAVTVVPPVGQTRSDGAQTAKIVVAPSTSGKSKATCARVTAAAP
jgi:hypothetical protein